MQKVQRWSQPFCTCDEGAGVRPRSRRSAAARGVARRHDVETSDARGCRQLEGRARSSAQLLGVAEDAVDLGHGGEACRLDLRGAAGDDDARPGCSRAQPADGLAGLPHRLGGDGAGVDDDERRRGHARCSMRRASPRIRGC